MLPAHAAKVLGDGMTESEAELCRMHGHTFLFLSCGIAHDGINWMDGIVMFISYLHLDRR